ncbi:ribosomal protein L10 [Mycoplasma haemofelis str. Langford 1]|uniref:Large ribosomal subunit protein uL10 n=2 Tax=Mycoplasma haemofelis TaxID=29501 RepID=F6FHD9_MYCHI|nr:50S ribosomal protein L10 [Mycoplasma haemofelis]AEG73769.1 50S ribosomal L10 [Mycoplasma haemofelis Ohio2]CBY93474.1 ribosomal protein L10 [Mycoplasma haemofelis str. Langford 1]
MNVNLEQKIREKSALVDSLAKEIKDYGSFLVFEYLGLTAEEISQLRSQLRKIDAKLVVHKNNILYRSLQKNGISCDEEIVGPNAILLSKNDISPFQNIAKLAKDKDFLKLKLAYFDNEIIKGDNLSLLATLGSKEDLLVRFSQTILSPLYKFAFMVKNIKSSE